MKVESYLPQKIMLCPAGLPPKMSMRFHLTRMMAITEFSFRCTLLLFRNMITLKKKLKEQGDHKVPTPESIQKRMSIRDKLLVKGKSVAAGTNMHHGADLPC